MKNKSLLFLTAFFLLCSFFLTEKSIAQTISSGFYNWGTLAIAVDQSTNKITGYYENYKDLDVAKQEFKYTCIFFFSGKFKEGEKSFPITTFIADGSESITGEIRIESDNKIRIQLSKERKSCVEVEKFAEKISPLFESTEKKDWISVMPVTSDKAYFYTDSNEKTKTRRFLSKGDCIKVIEEKGNWLKAEYTKGDGMYIVWMKKTELF